MSLQLNGSIEANPDRIDLDEAYMQMAEIWAKRSKASRKQVGCLIVKDKKIISDGYNGLPAGDFPDICETRLDDGSLVTKPDVIHAEINAIGKLAKDGGQGADGATVYVTLCPCLPCSRVMATSGVRKVFFRERYRDESGIEFLRRRGIEVTEL